MSITHSKVSAISDGGDTSLVRPSDWNDDHVLTGLLTSTSAALSGDVNLNNASNWFDGPSLSLTAGTWFIVGHANCQAGANNVQAEARLYDGTTVHAHAVGHIGTSGYRQSLPVAALVTLGGSVTMKLQAKSDTTSTVLKRDPTGNGFNVATQLAAVRVA